VSQRIVRSSEAVACVRRLRDALRSMQAQLMGGGWLQAGSQADGVAQTFPSDS
jgi:hypothetical protein